MISCSLCLSAYWNPFRLPNLTYPRIYMKGRPVLGDVACEPFQMRFTFPHKMFDPRTFPHEQWQA